jgi:hypothetical protein
MTSLHRTSVVPPKTILYKGFLHHATHITEVLRKCKQRCRIKFEDQAPWKLGRHSDRLQTGQPGFDFRLGRNIFVYSTASRPAFNPKGNRGLFPADKAAWAWSWSLSSTPPHVFMRWYLTNWSHGLYFSPLWYVYIRYIGKKMRSWNVMHCQSTEGDWKIPPHSHTYKSSK